MPVWQALVPGGKHLEAPTPAGEDRAELQELARAACALLTGVLLRGRWARKLNPTRPLPTKQGAHVWGRVGLEKGRFLPLHKGSTHSPCPAPKGGDFS